MALVRDTWYGHYDESGNMYLSVQISADPTYVGATTLTITSSTAGFDSVTVAQTAMNKTSNYNGTDTLCWTVIPFTVNVAGTPLIATAIKIAITDTGCGLPAKTSSFDILASPPDLKNFFF